MVYYCWVAHVKLFITLVYRNGLNCDEVTSEKIAFIFVQLMFLIFNANLELEPHILNWVVSFQFTAPQKNECWHNATFIPLNNHQIERISDMKFIRVYGDMYFREKCC
jgi:hypothetical protein